MRRGCSPANEIGFSPCSFNCYERRINEVEAVRLPGPGRIRGRLRPESRDFSSRRTAGCGQMSRQDANAAFALSSFLYGGNASYIEDLYARYETDPKSVDAEWQAFFGGLKDGSADVAKNARGPSWQRPDWPRPARSDLV